MSDCIFCRIVAGEIPATAVAQGEEWLAIRDINPAAPVHVLVIPRRHLDGVASLSSEDEALAGRLLLAAGEVARLEGVAQSGYRVVINQGGHGGQTVPHLHVHVIGGRQLSGHGTA
jgi:histidine triad (HIT) family protein